MSERTKLLKKAVLAGVGASTNVEHVKTALSDAMNDLVKVGQDLLNDLEHKGKDKTDSFQHYLKGLQEEATKRTAEVEKKAGSKLQDGTRDAVKKFGLATKEDLEELQERLAALEESVHGPSENGGEDAGKKRGKKRSSHE
jgi:polyhydroxyalkanoate synthesis regulator phasin